MELTNEFSVAAPVEEAWPLLTDIERIAPCVPGFQLKGASDGEYQGTMKVKVGAVQTTYDCVIRFVDRDEAQHRAVISAEGREKSGHGGLTASITSTLTPEGDSTHARMVTDLNVTGRVAQFGRGILADVSDRLVKQFVRQLESTILTPPEQKPSAGPSRTGSGNHAGGASDAPPPALSADAEALNLMSVAGAPLIKRLALVVVAVAALAVAVGWMRARGSR
jgi:hypothetical protein